MAIRDRFRRAMRKSVSHGSPNAPNGHAIRHTDTSMTTDSNTSNESDQSMFTPRPQSFFARARAFTWGTRGSSRTAVDNTSGDNSDNNDNDDPQQGTPPALMGLAEQVSLTLTRTASEAEREMKAEMKRQRKAKYQAAHRGTGGIHPRDKPLTAQNLKTQAMLGTWSWDEAAANSRRSFASGISPCCTRPPSTHGGDDYFDNGGASNAERDN